MAVFLIVASLYSVFNRGRIHLFLSSNVTVDPVQALAAARQSAGATALGLGLAVLAAAIGGTVGSKIWPGKDKNVGAPRTRPHRARPRPAVGRG